MTGCCGGNVPAQAPKCCCEGDKKNIVTADGQVPEVAPDKENEGAGNGGGCTNGGCKCGPNCNCNPCNCDK